MKVKIPGNQNLFVPTFGASFMLILDPADNPVYKPLNHVLQNLSVFVATSRTQDKKHKRLGAGVFPFSHTSWGLKQHKNHWVFNADSHHEENNDLS